MAQKSGDKKRKARDLTYFTILSTIGPLNNRELFHVAKQRPEFANFSDAAIEKDVDRFVSRYMGDKLEKDQIRKIRIKSGLQSIEPPAAKDETRRVLLQRIKSNGRLLLALQGCRPSSIVNPEIVPPEVRLGLAFLRDDLSDTDIRGLLSDDSDLRWAVSRRLLEGLDMESADQKSLPPSPNLRKYRQALTKMKQDLREYDRLSETIGRPLTPTKEEKSIAARRATIARALRAIRAEDTLTTIQELEKLASPDGFIHPETWPENTPT